MANNSSLSHRYKVGRWVNRDINSRVLHVIRVMTSANGWGVLYVAGHGCGEKWPGVDTQWLGRKMAGVDLQ